MIYFTSDCPFLVFSQHASSPYPYGGSVCVCVRNTGGLVLHCQLTTIPQKLRLSPDTIRPGHSMLIHSSLHKALTTMLTHWFQIANSQYSGSKCTCSSSGGYMHKIPFHFLDNCKQYWLSPLTTAIVPVKVQYAGIYSYFPLTISFFRWIFLI